MNNSYLELASANNTAYCNFCPAYCCYKLKGSSLLITAEDINRIARHFKISDGETRKKYIEGKNTFKTREDGSCILLTNGLLSKRCSIHTARPRQCVEFPYKRSCPYIIREDLLKEIQPRIQQSLMRLKMVESG